MKTLIIEDDYVSNEMFTRYMEKCGDCDAVTTGFDGMQKYRENLNNGQAYDLIIIDIILPDMNGYTVLDAIRTEEDLRKIPDPHRAKVVLTTSLDDEKNRKIREKLKPGYEAYYVKNFALDGLNKNLSELGLNI